MTRYSFLVSYQYHDHWAVKSWRASQMEAEREASAITRLWNTPSRVTADGVPLVTFLWDREQEQVVRQEGGQP